MSSIRVGISGWRYTPWRGVFYPADLPQRCELWYASRQMHTIEINGSFYSLQHPDSFQRWHDDTPQDFVFAVKGPRFITHMKRLREVAAPLANFFASGVFNLRAKLGPILWQFPPNFRYDRERLAQFFELLPHDTRAAQLLARKRDYRMKGRTRLAIDANRPIRHAIEIRHESFLEASFVDLLRDHGIALVVAETAGHWPLVHDTTADFMYVRLHGDRSLYKSGYSDRSLDRWAMRIKAWAGGREPEDAVRIHPSSARPRKRDVYCYFDNTDVKLRAPVDARTLMRKLATDASPARATRAYRRRDGEHPHHAASMRAYAR